MNELTGNSGVLVDIRKIIEQGKRQIFAHGVIFPSDEFFVYVSTDIFLHLLNSLIISCKNNINVEIRQIICTKVLNSDK